MRSRIFVPADWQTLRGAASLAIPFVVPRRVTVDFVTTGANLHLCWADAEGEVSSLLLFSGFGPNSVTFLAEREVSLEVDQDQDAVTSIRMTELRDLTAGWVGGSTFADIEPKRPFQISPEMQRAIDLMNRNAVRREMILLQALEKRLK